MATILLTIHASQFSIFLLAIHHIAVTADPETNESKNGVLLLVKCFNAKKRTIQDTKKNAV
ncbi:MAG TPA: hypothetical protein PLU54_11235, partial [Deltaproteobacteria bacterium]|nr:hypothetical protein [Deltaproteobacteria bacterium]